MTQRRQSAIRAVLWIGVFVLMLAYGPVAGASGKITDSLSGKPIAGATVYAVWYYHPFFSRYHDELACGGTSVVETDVNGEYSLGFWTGLNSLFHNTKYWVVAPGHYDATTNSAREQYGDFIQLLSTLTWRHEADPTLDSSRALTPFGDVSIDTKLLALREANNVESCVSGVAPTYEGMYAFQTAVKRAMNVALCPSGAAATAPRTDVFRAVFPVGKMGPMLWRELVDPLLPARGKNPIPDLALNNACALVDPAGNNSSQTSFQIHGSPRLRITLKDATDASVPAGVPVRVLWGEHATNLHKIDRDQAQTVPSHSSIATTAADGTAQIAVTQEMIDEQNPRSNNYEARFVYAVVPYAADWVGFDPTITNLGNVCSVPQLIVRVHDSRGMGGLVYGSIHCPSAGLRTAASGEVPLGMGVSQPRTAISQNEGSLKRAGAESASIPAQFQQLSVIADSESDRRNILHEAKPDRSTIYMYPWHWPAAALLARAYEAIWLKPENESDSAELIRLQRSQVRHAFEELCAEPGQEPLAQGFEVLRLLWWTEAQTEGIERANAHAQEHLASWDNGSRCRYRDGKMIMLGGTRPPNLLMPVDVCTDWKKLSLPADNASPPAEMPHGLDEFHVDFSQRADACIDMPHSGSSL
jgi:hypothetical protein